MIKHSLLLSLAVCSFTFADEKRTAEVQKLIEEKKAELAKLEAELEKLQPTKKLEKVDFLRFDSMKAGQYGAVGTTSMLGNKMVVESEAPLIVEKVIDKERVVVSIISNLRANAKLPPQRLLLVDVDTSNLVDEKVLPMDVIYEVLGIQEVNGKRMFALKPRKK